MQEIATKIEEEAAQAMQEIETMISEMESKCRKEGWVLFVKIRIPACHNHFTAMFGSNQNLTNFHLYMTDFYSFYLEICHSDATRPWIELDSRHSY